jgi:hypothetical protein
VALIVLRWQFTTIDLIEIQYFASLVRICHTEALRNVFRVQISTGQILFSLGYKKVPAFVVVLFLEIEDAGCGLIIKVGLLILLLRVVVEICVDRYIPVMCPSAISEFLGE